MPQPGLISVRTQVVLETLVDSITEAVAVRVDEPLPAEIEEALTATCGDERLARMGYLARAIEVERFERAREAMPWLSDRLRRDGVDGAGWSSAAGSVALALADAEPAERPDPGDARAVSWKVPGPGGHVRYYLAARAASEHGGRLTAEAKRSWLAGFLVHCLREVAPPG